MSSPSDSKGGGGGGAMGMNMVTTVMAFSVSAFFVLFVFVRLLCARLRLRTDHAAAHAGDAFVLQTYNVERGIHGLEPSVVTSFPTVKLGDVTPPGQEESQLRHLHPYLLVCFQCTVCLEEYAAKDVVRVLPACGHAFHAACIDAWLRQHPTCPVCRASLRAAKNHHHHRATTARAPASSSDVAASPHRSAADQIDAEHADRLEIVYEEPGSSAPEQQSAAVVDRSTGCGESARQSASSASEHR
ncbi:hypothetical protein EJB05_21485 [Eragrostis curvula]|uniref:RING-type domain-containing protein n=1 Tax=Eragrostis curvula TaxID=38414 RepID=A0A5J9V2Z3_9POAL|nr:hypothetical protein EJB05_21485 [Eragrostis curvula]